MYKTSTCKKCGNSFRYHTGSSKGVFCSSKCCKEYFPKKIIKCEQCHKEIKVSFNNLRKKFCSRNCYNEYKNFTPIVSKCEVCEKLINTVKEKRQKFCSYKCSYIGRRKERIIRKCLECGKKFEDYVKKNKGIHTFCSQECWRKHSKQVEVTKVCPQCKKEFVFKKCLNNTTKHKDKIFCSRECQCRFLFFYSNYASHNRGNSGKRLDLNNQFFRSTWEANFARICNEYNTEWLYESERFWLPELKSFYHPDFFLPEVNLYVEITGMMTERKLLKLQYFQKNYPEKVILHITQEDWRQYFAQFKPLVKEWE